MSEETRSVSSFAALGISQPLVRALKMLSITVPTPIQAATIPAILEGRDVIGGAETGSGKTLAFALPILNELRRDMVGGFGLILTPTRELAVQLHEQFLAVGQGSRMGLKCALVLGGMDMMKQAIELAGQRPHLIVATPGRLADLLRSGGAQEWGLERCKFVVLDEADRLLSPTFANELAYLFSILPPARMRQTLLFTATLTPEIEKLTQKKPEAGKLPPLLRKIEMATSTPATLTQQYVFVPSHVREPYLYYLLHHPPCRAVPPRAAELPDVYRKGARNAPREAASAEPSVPLTIVFAARCETAELLSRMLTELGVDNVSLHSLLPQSKRLDHLQAFRARRVPVLISTDVGSRGLDIPDVEMVVNWDVPAAWEDYVHRVGRTARKGKKGWAVSFVTERDVELVHTIEDKIGQQLAELELPESRVLEELSQVKAAKRVASMALHDEHFGEQRERNKKKAKIAQGESGKRKRAKAGP
ncbi:RNA helicase [Malassezia brasiliensis]|uniref:RNA helicase n=1 Tax=Malassezia brasiliensis TaxID=1821822 RepID=A0AAF0IQ63_9BASI|nr:RNA helicase [Malassezia brasiliensis]